MEEKMLRMKQILEMIPVQRSTIWIWTKEGRFPQPVKLGQATVCWRLSDVQQFIDKSGVQS